MKITFFALGAKLGAFGERSYVVGRGGKLSAAQARSLPSIAPRATAPKPSPASRNASLRLRILRIWVSLKSYIRSRWRPTFPESTDEDPWTHRERRQLPAWQLTTPQGRQSGNRSR